MTHYTQCMDRMLDGIFGSVDYVIGLIRNKNWEEASKYGDQISYQAVINNADWWWKQIDDTTKIDPTWNSCAYGNAAMGIHYGSTFPDRSFQIERLKKMFSAL